MTTDLDVQQIAGYELLALIGAGGMGEVYKAHDKNLGRPVALKLLPLHLTHDPERLRRFRAEARAASSLNHPHILVVHDFGDFNGRPFMVTEFVEGQTLRQRIDADPIVVREAVDIATQVASALAAAHARGIVHRDIKPENVMLRPDGYVKVLDFGLARQTMSEETAPITATQPGTLVGTLRYMSPEQSRGQPVQAPSDVFSLASSSSRNSWRITARCSLPSTPPSSLTWFAVNAWRPRRSATACSRSRISPAATCSR